MTEAAATIAAPAAVSPPPTFEEFPLHGRYKLAYEWTPGGLDVLLDAGCAWGYGTRFFTDRAGAVHGLDPNARAIEVARERYPDIDFREGTLEQTTFDDESFDAVICCETLEHVRDDRACLSELHRLLKPGGVLTVTVPHRGPLGFLDPDTLGVTVVGWAKRRLPWLYRWYRSGPAKHDPAIAPTPVDDPGQHRHYTVSDLRSLLEQSSFGRGYEITRVRRTGFALEVAAVSVHFVLRRLIRGRARPAIDAVAGGAIALDNRLSYGPLANNLALQIRKPATDSGGTR